MSIHPLNEVCFYRVRVRDRNESGPGHFACNRVQNEQECIWLHVARDNTGHFCIVMVCCSVEATSIWQDL
jgi:hypothetical protein